MNGITMHGDSKFLLHVIVKIKKKDADRLSSPVLCFSYILNVIIYFIQPSLICDFV